MKPSDLKVYADQADECGFDDLATFLKDRAEVICEGHAESTHENTRHSFMLVGGPRHGTRMSTGAATRTSGFPGNHMLQVIEVPVLRDEYTDRAWVNALETTAIYDRHTYHLEYLKTGPTLMSYYRHSDLDPVDVLYTLLFVPAAQTTGWP